MVAVLAVVEEVMDSPRMTVAEIAELLGVSQQTVYDYAGMGRIPHIRLGRRLVFPRPAVMEWFRTAGKSTTLPSTKAG